MFSKLTAKHTCQTCGKKFESLYIYATECGCKDKDKEKINN